MITTIHISKSIIIGDIDGNIYTLNAANQSFKILFNIK